MATKAPAKRASARKRAPRKAAARSGVSDSQKQAMQQGRQEGAAIRRYLEALKVENAPKKKGRRKTPDQMRARIAEIEAQLSNGIDPMREVELRQERLLLTSDLQTAEPKAKSAEFEGEFVKAVKNYSERRGVAYDVWREMGVPAALLQKAGLRR